MSKLTQPRTSPNAYRLPVKALAFMDGVRVHLPVIPGVIPFGLVTGITATKQGFSFVETMGMTLLFYAGSAQMVTFQLLQEEAFPLVILLTVLVINLRFMMYSASLAPYLHTLPLRWKWPMSYMLSDQAYALSISKLSSDEPKILGHYFFAGTALSQWFVWNISVVAGVSLGAGIPASWSLEFAIPLAFLALLIPSIKTLAHLGAACVGGGVAILAIHMPYNLGMLVAALSGISAGFIIELFFNRYGSILVRRKTL